MERTLLLLLLLLLLLGYMMSGSRRGRGGRRAAKKVPEMAEETQDSPDLAKLTVSPPPRGRGGRQKKRARAGNTFYWCMTDFIIF